MNTWSAQINESRKSAKLSRRSKQINQIIEQRCLAAHGLTIHWTLTRCGHDVAVAAVDCVI